jgi:outer membrane protein TolC
MACAMLFAAGEAHAEGELRVSRAEAMRIAALRGPGVVAARAPLPANQRAEEAAKAVLVLPPRLNTFAGARRGAFGSGLEVGASVMQDFYLRNLGDKRKRAAAAATQHVELDVARAKLEASIEGALAWVDALEAEELLRLRRERRKQAQALADVARARVSQGVAVPTESALAEADAAALRAGELEAEGLLVEAHARLRFAMGLDAGALVAVEGNLYDGLERAPGLDGRDTREALARVESHPALLRARAEANAAEAETALQHASGGPVLSLGAAYGREGTGEQTVTAVAQVPLPFFDPAAFDRARQESFALSRSAAVARVRAELERDIRLALHERTHAREVLRAWSEGALGPTREASRIARRQYESGAQDIVVVLTAAQRLGMAEEQAARAAADVQRADIRLAYARGTLLESGGVAR